MRVWLKWYEENDYTGWKNIPKTLRTKPTTCVDGGQNCIEND